VYGNFSPGNSGFRKGLLRRFLFTGNRFALAFAGSGICGGPLATHGQTFTVADTPVATNVHQPLDVHLHLGAECTFEFVIGNDLAQAGDLFVGPVFYLFVGINPGFGQNLRGPGAPDAINVSEANATSLNRG